MAQGVAQLEQQEQQDEELEALEAIFGDDDVEVDRQARSVKVYVPCRSHERAVVLCAVLVDGYPRAQPPALQLLAPHCSDDVLESAVREMEQQFVPGEVVLYQWAEWVREHGRHLYDLGVGGHPGDGAALGSPAPRTGDAPPGDDDDDRDWEPGDDDAGSSGSGDDEEEAEGEGEGEGWAAEDAQQWAEEARRRREAAAAARAARTQGGGGSLLDAVRGRIVSGEPMTERKSTFQAHVCRVSSPEEAAAVVEVLLENNKIRNATHNIMAYRIACRGRGTFYQDADDDGEAAAGGRLLHLLQVAGAEDVVVVVSRWFGGVLLGPSRFTLINNTARALLEQQAVIAPGGKSAGRHR